MSPPPGFATRVRLFAFRLLRGGAAWVEPRDPSHLAQRLANGEVVWRAYKEAGVALIGAGRFDEAERMIVRGLSSFPDDPEFLIDHALCAHNAGRYAEAVERWTKAMAHVQRPMPYAGLAANLRELGELDRAQTTIDEGLQRFPDDLAVVTEAARIAQRRARLSDALVLWEKAIAPAKPHVDWLQGHAQTLVRLGAFDEADAAIRAALATAPDHPGLLGVEGALAVARQDWPKAVALWTAYRRRFPNDPTGWEQLGIASQGMQFAGAEEPSGDEVFRPALPAKIDIVDDEPMRDLMLRFESLGDNCELGLVQRRYGAEPLGLLRWNTVALNRLIEAAQHRFDGMGAPENVDLAVAANGEFFVQDRRWFLGMHTFLMDGQADPDVLRGKMGRRVAYLRDKLLQDLEAAEKIFVYRSLGIDRPSLEALHTALRAFGPVRLLAVQPAAAVRPSDFAGVPGDLVRAADDLYVGFLSRSGVDRLGNWNIAFDDWAAICRKATEAMPARG